MNYKFLSNASISRKRKWLIDKGYELARTADNDYINKLFDLYKPVWLLEAEKQKKKLKAPVGKEWKMWQGTNRPHDSGGRKDRSGNHM